MKQILHVCAFGSQRPGNFIESLMQLQNRMQDIGYETIYAFTEDAKDRSWCKDIQKTNRVYFLPVARARILPKTYLLIKQIYNENDIDIVHSHFELYDIPVTIMAPKKVKVFWHLHDAIKENYKNAKLSRKILYKLQYGLLSTRATMLTVSQLHGQFAVELGFNREKVVFVPNGINFDRFDGKYYPQNENQFLMFGWEVYRKGVDLVVDAEKYLRNSDYCINIIGLEQCERYIKDNTQSTQIHLLKPVDDVKQLFSKTKVFVHASRAEGLSYALLEAIYFGMYIICSDISENMFAKEFHGVDLFHNEDCDELKKLLGKYITRSGLEEKYVLENRKKLRQKYSIETWCDNVMKVYFEG